MTHHHIALRRVPRKTLMRWHCTCGQRGEPHETRYECWDEWAASPHRAELHAAIAAHSARTTTRRR